MDANPSLLSLYPDCIARAPDMKPCQFKAVNTRDKNYTRARVQWRIEQIEESVAWYLSELDNAETFRRRSTINTI